MKKYMIIFLLVPFNNYAGGNEGLKTTELPNQKYTKQNDNANPTKQAVEAAKEKPAPEKESKCSLLALLKCCCCGTAEK